MMRVRWFTCKGDRSARVNEELDPFVEWRDICLVLRISPGDINFIATIHCVHVIVFVNDSPR